MKTLLILLFTFCGALNLSLSAHSYSPPILDEGLLESLFKNGYFIEEGGENLRNKYLDIQRSLEQLFASKQEIYGAVGMAHTTSPRLPLSVNYLVNGRTFYLVYPQGGEDLLSEKEHAAYLDALKNHSGSLFDWSLSCKTLNPEMHGVLYFFRTQNGQFVVSIKTRANNDYGQWGIWFGKVDTPVIQNRLKTLFHYIVENDGPTFACFGVGRLKS